MWRKGLAVSAVGVAAMSGMVLLGTLLASLHRGGPRSPLAAAAGGGGEAEGMELLRQGGPPHDQGRFPPLAWAARAGEVGVVEALIAAGADPERLDRGPNGWTPLLHAIHKN